ncbi:MAG: hypothetical protein WC683_07135 [bacterium]
MPTGKYGHSDAGKGDQRRPSDVSEAEWSKRWDAAFGRDKPEVKPPVDEEE